MPYGWGDIEVRGRVRFSQSTRGEVTSEPTDRVLAVKVELRDFGPSAAHLDWPRFP